MKMKRYHEQRVCLEFAMRLDLGWIFGTSTVLDRTATGFMLNSDTDPSLR